MGVFGPSLLVESTDSIIIIFLAFLLVIVATPIDSANSMHNAVFSAHAHNCLTGKDCQNIFRVLIRYCLAAMAASYPLIEM
jgi:hypothetical protein